MKVLFAAEPADLIGQSTPNKNTLRILLLSATLVAAAWLCPPAAAGPDPGVTNGSTVFYGGNQTQGVIFQVGPTVPATLVVSNLFYSILPNEGVAGVQIAGTDSGRNVTAIIDTNVVISTGGDYGYGIFAENGGGFAGNYQYVSNSFTVTTNVVGGSNVITITTNVISGVSNNYAVLAPAGGTTVNNAGQVTTSGNNAPGILADSLPGTINLTLNGSPVITNQNYGPGGPVTVFNSGRITTYGINSSAIFAQSLGGFGPENSGSGGTGSVVTVQSVGTLTANGAGSFGIFAQSRGGDNQGGESGGAGGDGNNGGSGGVGGPVSVTGGGYIYSYGDNGGGIFALSQGGNGGNGGNGGTVYGSGGNGGSGAQAGAVVVNGAWNIQTFGTNADGINAQSLGGYGGSGGNETPGLPFTGGAGNGGGTANGGTVSITSMGTIQTSGLGSQGIFARSVGGFAGNGGNGYNAFYGDAGGGNSAGSGSNVTVVNGGSITTQGDDSQAIYAESVGGGGGSAGSGGALVTLGASGGAGGNAGVVTVTNSGALTTYGVNSHGIEAQSVGGGGGDGGSAGGFVALGGSGSAASTGSVVTVYNTGAITTRGSNSYGILAQSLGGGGGSAGSSGGALSLGGSGAGGGDGGAVYVFNSGGLTNTGINSYGIFAQSLGGGGGNGGSTGGLVAIGGGGGTASQGDVVNVVNTGSILSSDDAIFAQSIGGGGGNGGNGYGWFPIGGTGGGGGDGAAVTVTNMGSLRTTEASASGLLAQSVGGGGGDGGNTVSAGAFVSKAIGGAGGKGGNGGIVNVVSGTNQIVTGGDNSFGINAQSVGGGGGEGGFAISVAAGTGPITAAIGIGGTGGGGGSANSVTVVSSSAITTYGTNSHGIFAQSIGGGGGAGGYSVAVSASDSTTVSLSMGGTGGGGGNGGLVNVTNTGAITTTNTHSYGIIAQSVGGGGGDGGFAIAGSLSTGGIAASLAFGGSGATGGVASAVSVVNGGAITTDGSDSHAILAQSVGGGGGSGGFSVAGSIGTGSSRPIGASFGGSGGGGESADAVNLFNDATLTTMGDRSDGILAQSVGGGGGAGGFSVAGAIGQSSALSLSFGGTGGTGGNASTVTVTNVGGISTSGSDSQGILAQSVGGGGGNGGFGVAGSLIADSGVTASLAMGGNGTTGGVASAVVVVNGGVISTHGTNADGILAQSIGGGGGNGGFAGAGSLGIGNSTEGSAQLSASVGGTGGLGNVGGTVMVNNLGQITTTGENAIGIFAQSVGGGGGNGGMSFDGGFSSGSAGQASIAIGGNGGTGGNASDVNVISSGNITTFGDEAHGILAQSVGGGGGNGGLAAAIDFGVGNSVGVIQFGFSLGGKGMAGGTGGNVFVGGSNSIVTMGQDADGVFEQSVGGGGGAGGFSVAASGVLGAAQGDNRALTLSIGGSGGAGNNGGTVTMNRSGSIQTSGDGAYGIVAQSVGGGGGVGGGSRSFSLFTIGGGQQGVPSSAASINVTIGGNGLGGGSGGTVLVTNVGSINTSGADAYGIMAQSIGGGGGAGGSGDVNTADLVPDPIPGLNVAVRQALTTSASQLSVAVGGSGGSSGSGGQVLVNQQGDIMTLGVNSYGIFAQSVGGGGGVGGNGMTGLTGTVGIGGQAGSAGNGGEVDVIYSGNIITTGDGASGIFAQSVGGGGGVAGGVDRGLVDAGLNIGVGLAFGRGGGSAGNGTTVNVTSSGTITTGGTGADGIFAQSVGGGGGLVGNLGNNIPVISTLTDFAGSVGNSGSAGDVTVSHTGQITTYGTNAAGIFAQSAGGSDMSGGNVSVTLNGSIYANGVDSDGIYVQTSGGVETNGSSTVTISSNSIVQGGSSSGSTNAAGVRVMYGINNRIENYGTITTLGGVNGTGIAGTNGNIAIDNFGTVIGSVTLGTNANAFNNMTGAVFMAGSQIYLGAGNPLANSGTVSLGGAGQIQTSALTGNFLQSSNGSLQVKLAAVNSYDILNTSGSADLDGNLSAFRFDNYLPVKGNEFTFLTASNVTGEFASLYDPLKGNYAINLRTIYSPTNALLQVYQVSFVPFALTPNQRSVAGNLDSFSGVGTTNGDLRGSNLVYFLDTQNKTQLPGDFDLISPSQLGATFDLDFASINLMSGNLRQRMSQIRAGNHVASGSISSLDSSGRVLQVASAAPDSLVLNHPSPDDDWGVFASGNGQYVHVDGSANSAGYHFDSGGLTLGADKMLCDHAAVGVSLDYAGTKASLISNGFVNSDSARAGVYGTWFDKDWYLESAIGGGYTHYSTVRAALGGFASGGTGGLDCDALVGGGYNIRRGNFTFGPEASLHYTFVRVNQFTESGSMAPLQLQDNNSHSFLTGLGAHTAYDWTCGKVLLRPELQVSWQHEFMDANRAIDSRLASGVGDVFTVNSPSFGRDSLGIDAYFTVQWTHRVSSFLGCHADLRAHYTAETANGGFAVSF